MRTVISPALPILFSLFLRLGRGAGSAASQPPAGAGSELTEDPSSHGRRESGFHKPNMAGAPVDSTYEIGPEDVITVWVYQQPNMIGQYVVRHGWHGVDPPDRRDQSWRADQEQKWKRTLSIS